MKTLIKLDEKIKRKVSRVYIRGYLMVLNFQDVPKRLPVELMQLLELLRGKAKNKKVTQYLGGSRPALYLLWNKD